MRRRTVAVALGALVSPALWAQTWPTKPIKIVVPFAAGGSVDTYARQLGVRLAERLGKPVIVENRAGAGGMIGSDYVAKSPPDGYTLVWGTVSSHAINMTLYSKPPYDSVKDFAPVTQLMEQPLMLVVPLNSKIGSLADLHRVLQTRSAKLSVGSAGVGTTGHMTTELIKRRTGGDLVHAGYKGSNPMLTDLIGGHIDMGIDNLPSAIAQVRGGKLKALAITGDKRSPLTPEIPTLSEQLPGLKAVAWQGLFAPSGTPEPVLEQLAREVNAILTQPEFVALLAEGGSSPGALSRGEFGAFVKAETARWAELVKISGARAQE